MSRKTGDKNLSSAVINIIYLSRCMECKSILSFPLHTGLIAAEWVHNIIKAQPSSIYIYILYKKKQLPNVVMIWLEFKKKIYIKNREKNYRLSRDNNIIINRTLK